MSSKNQAIGRLFRFMLTFEINRFWIFDVTDYIINAKVGWADTGAPHYDEDEETQYIQWSIQNLNHFEDALYICELLVDRKLLSNDRIEATKEELWGLVGWDIERYTDAINTLLEIKVDMMDDGRKSDSFFLHF